MHSLISPLMLTSVDLTNCTQITDCGVIYLCEKFSRLRHLTLNGVMITEKSGVVISTFLFATLVSLDVGRCTKIRTSLLDITKKCYLLEHLNISGTCDLVYQPTDVAENWRIDDQIVERISANCLQLKTLNIASCQCVTPSSVRRLLSNCTMLQTLHINRNAKIAGSLESFKEILSTVDIIC